MNITEPSFISRSMINDADNDTSLSSSSASAAATVATMSPDRSIPTIRQVTALWISMPIAIVGIIGNILSLVVLGRRQRRLRQAQASSATLGKPSNTCAINNSFVSLSEYQMDRFCTE